MPQFEVECTTSVKGGVCRRFIVGAADEASALAYFRTVLTYPNPRLRIWSIADDSLIPDIIIDSALAELWPGRTSADVILTTVAARAAGFQAAATGTEPPAGAIAASAAGISATVAATAADKASINALLAPAAAAAAGTAA